LTTPQKQLMVQPEEQAAAAAAATIEGLMAETPVAKCCSLWVVQ
jgi:hypothetical protein